MVKAAILIIGPIETSFIIVEAKISDSANTISENAKPEIRTIEK